MNSERFIDVKLAREGMGAFVLRSGIHASLKRSIREFRGRVLDVGCGCMPYREVIKSSKAVTGYVGLDIEGASVYDASVVPDYRWDGWVMPFGDGEFDTAMATEVLEHCPDPGVCVRETARVLRPGSALFVTVPFVHPVHESPHDYQRFTAYGLKRLLLANGFGSCEIGAHGGPHAAMAHMIGLFASAVRIAEWKRKMITLLAIPAMRYLLAKDRTCDPFAERALFPGLYAVARK